MHSCCWCCNRIQMHGVISFHLCARAAAVDEEALARTAEREQKRLSKLVILQGLYKILRGVNLEVSLRPVRRLPYFENYCSGRWLHP